MLYSVPLVCELGGGLMPLLPLSPVPQSPFTPLTPPLPPRPPSPTTPLPPRAVGADAPGDKAIQQHVIDEAAGASPKKPLGCRGDSPIAFGGGEVVAARASR